MIVRDTFQIQDVESGLFYKNGYRGMGRGYDLVPYWVRDQFDAGQWGAVYIDRWMSEHGKNGQAVHGYSIIAALPPDNVERKLRRVPAPHCGCCGKNRYEAKLKLVAGISGDPDTGNHQWRCEKHIGRNPCCIEGCGKTFALQPDKDGRGAEDYSWRIMCGKCWRQAPKWMRDRVAKIRRLARRRGWTDRIQRLHGMAWEACYRAIVDGRRLDMTEINKMFGWA